MIKKLQEKRKRIADAVALQKPDRVPFYLVQNYMPARTENLTYKDAHYDIDAWANANRTFINRYDPDMYYIIDGPSLGAAAAHEILGTLSIKWPGGDLPDNTPHQFVEGEYMLQSEYDHFLDDPTDYLLRVYTPRIFSGLKGLAKLPPLKALSLGHVGVGLFGVSLSDPELTDALQKLIQMSKPAAEFFTKTAQFHSELLKEGQICAGSGFTIPPFDLISDLMRGMRGSMIDMFQVPNKLIAAMDKLYPLLFGAAVQGATASGNKQIFIMLTRGADGFMSLKQFEKFYWPYLKQLICDLINAGLTPIAFFEGNYEQRLDYLAELPAGKMIGWFDRSDLKLLQEKLGDVMCVAAGMPVSLLQTGTIDTVRQQTKKAIDIFDKRGLIMAPSTMLDEAKPELLQAWVDATREFGA